MVDRWSADEWIACWTGIEASIQGKQMEKLPASVAEQFFRSRYTNESEANWKMDRFLLAYRYLVDHLDAFEGTTALIASSKAIRLDTSVLVALSAINKKSSIGGTFWALRFMIENPGVAILGTRQSSLDSLKIKNLANLKRRDFLEEVLPSLVRAQLGA
jgi:hypothetical protein